MWMVIFLAHTRLRAEAIYEQLLQEGFLVRLSPVYRAVSDSENYYELMVLKSEAQEARQMLLDKGLCC